MNSGLEIAGSPILKVVAMLALLALPLPAQKFKVIQNFDGANGMNPESAVLLQGLDGNLYGTTGYGGQGDAGVVFKMTPSGAITVLYSFCPNSQNCTDGAGPDAGLVLGTDGNFYGTTIAGGSEDAGTVFRITPQGVLTKLHDFSAFDGHYPVAPLIQATNGNFYGTAWVGGNTQACPGDLEAGCGTVFEITSKGTFRTVHAFNLADGASPLAGLTQGADGNLYGTTWQGGDDGYGTIFRITTSGKFSVLHNFGGHDGEYPSPVLLESASTFYGTAAFGGSYGYGTIFSITPHGAFTLLHSFKLSDGYIPVNSMVLGADGNIYAGTGSGGGSKACGTLYKFTPSGVVTVLKALHLSDGCYADNGLVQLTNGTIYGLTYGAGAYSSGTAFSLSVGLGPFVATVPVGGSVGSAVKILGTTLGGAMGVTFNGIAAPFAVVSGSYIKTRVPAGATTGPVQVVIPSGTLTSKVNFQVLP